MRRAERSEASGLRARRCRARMPSLMRRVVKSALVAGLAIALPGVVLAGPQLGGQDANELDAMQNELSRFEEAAKDFKGTVSHIVQREYQEKRRQTMARYQGQLDKLEGEEKTRRGAAIVMFENFLQKYAHDDRWTPDAMFRLAELYFEKSNDEYLTATAQAANTGAQVTPDYQKTIDIYKDLITRFPSYRIIDGAYYLMGWCLGEMNKEAESLQAMRSLVCASKYKPLDPPPPPTPSKGRGQKVEDPYTSCEPIKKDSRFLPEAWTRVGEAHFDNSELELAIAAYSRVLQFTDSPYYDKALYKLAWSHYRADNYPEAIKRFDELVVYSDKKKSESGTEGSDLRTEAVQYLGISFSEKDWNGDGAEDTETGLQRAEQFYRGREGEQHVREIFAKLGDIYFDETEFAKAIDVYKRTLQKWPYDAGNPKLQDRVVLAYQRMRDNDSAMKEIEVLADKYREGGEWDKRNRDNSEARATARSLTENAMITAAVNHHKAAQDLKKMIAAKARPDGKILEQISKEYAQAAVQYEKYLEKYPTSKNSYEYRYSYAETLYYSGRFLDAAREYETVRDSNLDNKYAEDASFNAIKSYEKYLETQTMAGRYKAPPKPDQDKLKAPITPIAIPEPVQKLQKAYDAFVARVPNSGRTPTMNYKAAEIDYDYLHWAEARPRMEQIVGKNCKDEIGHNAAQALLSSYIIEKDLDKIEEWGNKLKTGGCGVKDTVGVIKGVRFERANKLFADGKFEEAARLYIQIIDADPTCTKDNEIDKALNNAAVCYEKVQRYAAAMKIYERIVSDCKDSTFLDDALFRTAVSYQKAFDFSRAVVSYLRLADDKAFASSKHHTDAIYNAAILSENDQNYPKAASLFQRYAADSSVKKEDQAEAFFRSALIFEKMKDWPKTLKTFQQYVKTYGTDPKGSTRNIEAYFRMAQAYEQTKQKSSADDMYKRVVSLGVGVAPASDPAEYAAHAAFVLTEEKLPALEKAKIQGGGKQLEKSINGFKQNVQNMVAEYNKVLGYRRATWTLAAYFRTGYLFELFSKALLAAPCPPEVKKLGPDACDIYRQQIEQAVASVDEEVVKRYGVTLQQAGQLGVSNDWTRLARTSAHNYNPDKFPLVKDEHIAGQDLQTEVP
jgi:tetratricopeptide (TPR) repeat protein